jgi:serine/threonine protein kinase
MKVSKGSYGVVKIDKQAGTARKKENLYDNDGDLDFSSVMDAVMSRFVSSIGSPYLAKLNSVDVGDSHIRLNMPYHGLPLADWISRTPKDRRLAKLPMLLYQLASACEALLINDIQHTDIKPMNILIGEDEQLVLIDYNIYSVKTVTAWVDGKGTWCYVAPEILIDSKPHDNSMTWSIGILISEILSGYPLGSVN